MIKEYLAEAGAVVALIGAALGLVAFRWRGELVNLHKSQLAEKDQQLKSNEATIKSKDATIEIKNAEIGNLNSLIQRLEKQSPLVLQKQYEQCIATLEREIKYLKETIDRQVATVNELTAQARSDRETIRLGEEKLAISRQQLEQLEKQLERLQTANTNLLAVIELIKDNSLVLNIDAILKRFSGDRDGASRRCEIHAEALRDRAFIAAASARNLTTDAVTGNRKAEAAFQKDLHERREGKTQQVELPFP
jgi:chromosome segregation ATPase